MHFGHMNADVEAYRCVFQVLSSFYAKRVTCKSFLIDACLFSYGR